MLNTFFVSSPLDQFEVTQLISLDAPFLGSNLTLTNLGLYSILVVIVFLGLHFLSVNSQRVVPSR
jgi:F-type H+-transporting ATPase subunit a